MILLLSCTRCVFILLKRLLMIFSQLYLTDLLEYYDRDWPIYLIENLIIIYHDQYYFLVLVCLLFVTL